MSETPFDLAAAQEHVRRGREIVAQQEQRAAIRMGCGDYCEDDEKLLVTFRRSLDLFEDHLDYLSRLARPVLAETDPRYLFVVMNV